ncbi:YfhO family protein [Macrococcus equipercicus]|nr:YfhO family protein [Macrococcus equipercicus]
MMKPLNRLPAKLLTLCLLLSLAAHSVVIYRFFAAGTLFTGKGDGLAQMIPFQMYLYEQFSHFNFFYDMGFGIGGDFFRSLAYYYSTSPIAYLYFTVVYVLDLILPLPTQHVDFWAVNQLTVSIFKLAVIIYVMFRMLRYFGINKYAAMTGAMLYSYSTVYFFFTFTWSFFSDVMLYLPLTILGMERFFHEKKIGLFILGIAVTLHSNFYFSYYEFIFVLFYFLYRTIYPKRSDIVPRLTKVCVLTIAVLLAVMTAAVGFYTGVTSYLLNDRTLPPLKLKPFIDFNILYNVFYHGYYVVIPFITVMALITFKLYRNYTFRLFAVITLLFLAGSLSPLFDSFFNGFSIDQRRWVYFLVFSSAVVCAVYLQHIRTLSAKDIAVSLLPVVIIYPLSIYSTHQWLPWLVFVPVIITLIFMVPRSEQRLYVLLTGVIIYGNFYFVHDYITAQMDTLHPADIRNMKFIHSGNYNSAVQQSMIQTVTTRHPSERIDWQTSATHNTPMYQHFNGIKLYSSIFDKDIYQFYDKALNITMDTDSNSIYYRLGERANLYALFNVNHSLRTNNTATLPYGFRAVDKRSDAVQHYTMYANQYQLPVVRVTDRVFSPSALKTPIDREHAMLRGVVLEDTPANAAVAPARNLLPHARVTFHHAALNGTHLAVDQDQGGMTFTLDKELANRYKDLYIDVSIELKSPSKYHYVWFNEIYQSRKPLDDDYRRFNPRITMRIKSSPTIDLKLMTGRYTVKINGIYGEDYRTLQAAAHAPTHQLKQAGSKLVVTLGTHDPGYAVIPTPYLKGMTARVDGRAAEIMEGNYLMTAVKIGADARQIVISYTPPWFHLMQLISIIGILSAVVFSRKLYRRELFPKEYRAVSNEEDIDYVAPEQPLDDL